ncbi:MAG TPA: CPBP family intramembrane glutamic endopeptidase [Anaerolineales bacterium]|nr:CPBP family intramembrane glutamic endopeptidase [Anaerolineales bacterium]
MNSEIREPVVTPNLPNYSVPWKFMDNWIGVALLAIIDVIIFIIMSQGRRTEIAQSAAVILLEMAYLLPVVLIFAWRRIHWKHLGFGRFEWSTLGIGCGLLVASYVVIIVHNALLYLLGVDTQGQAIIEMFAELDSPIWFFIVGAIFAPLVEEIFFRGFLFQGFRQRYGWVNAMLVSSAIFAIAHLDLVVLIPTFVLGCLLAYVYQRSNSIWPGVIIHFLVNSFGLLAAYFASNYPNMIPV